MPTVCLGWKVHIPLYLKKAPGDPEVPAYFDEAAIRALANQYADQCYLPANAILLREIRRHQGRFRIAFSISGTTLEIFRTWRKDVLHSFQELVRTGCVDLYGETYYQSLSWLYSKTEFERQVRMHAVLTRELFGIRPAVVRNTDLICCNDFSHHAAGMGFKAVLCEGLQEKKGTHPANRVYAAPGNGDFGLLLRHTSLSDDIAFRFDDPAWPAFPLSAPVYAEWLQQTGEEAELVNLFFDYETFGIFKNKECGIFRFLKELPDAVLRNNGWQFLTPSEVTDHHYPRALYDVPQPRGWGGRDRTSCAGSGQMMQHNSLQKIYSLESMLQQSRIPGILDTWGRLQSADHFNRMCPGIHPGAESTDAKTRCENPEEAYQLYQAALTDLEIRLIREGLQQIRRTQAQKQDAAEFYSTIY